MRGSTPCTESAPTLQRSATQTHPLALSPPPLSSPAAMTNPVVGHRGGLTFPLLKTRPPFKQHHPTTPTFRVFAALSVGPQTQDCDQPA